MKKVLSTALLLAAATSSQAQFTDFSVVNGINDPGLNVFLEITESNSLGFSYDFTITNLSDSGNITGVYFEEDWSRLMKTAGLSTGPATYYPASLNPDIDTWNGSKVSHKVWHETEAHMVQRGVFTYTYHNVVADGLAPGQSHTFSFFTDTIITPLSKLHESLATEGYGVALQIQGIDGYDPEAPSWLLANSMPTGIGGGGGGDITASTVAPTPGAASLAVAGGLLVLCRRRRR